MKKGKNEKLKTNTKNKKQKIKSEKLKTKRNSKNEKRNRKREKGEKKEKLQILDQRASISPKYFLFWFPSQVDIYG